MKLLPLSFAALCCCVVMQAQNLAYTPAQENTILIAAPVINEMNQATIADSFNVWVDVLNTINPEIKNELYHIQSRGFRLNYYQKTKKQNVKCGTEDKSGNTYFGGVNSLIANASLTGLVIKVNANGWSIPGKGIMGSICNALTNDPSGNIYAGGVFSKLGKITVSNKYSTIAKFDGRKWTQLGSQLKGHVYRMYTDKLGRIYVCGNFSVKNDSTLQYLVRWNGSAWEGLGEGLNGPVFATYYSEEGLVYACGSFTASGTGSTAYEKTNRTLAFFDGAEWKPLPGGTTINKGAYIDAMLIKDNALYVRGGGIDSINGKPVSSTGPQEINFLKYQFPTATDLGGFNGNDHDPLNGNFIYLGTTRDTSDTELHLFSQKLELTTKIFPDKYFKNGLLSDIKLEHKLSWEHKDSSNNDIFIPLTKSSIDKSTEGWLKNKFVTSWTPSKSHTFRHTWQDAYERIFTLKTSQQWNYHHIEYNGIILDNFYFTNKTSIENKTQTYNSYSESSSFRQNNSSLDWKLKRVFSPQFYYRIKTGSTNRNTSDSRQLIQEPGIGFKSNFYKHYHLQIDYKAAYLDNATSTNFFIHEGLSKSWNHRLSTTANYEGKDNLIFHLSYSLLINKNSREQKLSCQAQKFF